MGEIFTALGAKIFAGIGVALALFCLWQTLQLSGARSANLSLEQQLTTASAKLQLANSSIDSANKIADERQKRADDLLAVAKKQTVVHVDAARDILSIPTPTPDKECAATLQLLKDHQ